MLIFEQVFDYKTNIVLRFNLDYIDATKLKELSKNNQKWKL